jgi:predicted RNA-binding Zn ribbon-like protein
MTGSAAPAAIPGEEASPALALVNSRHAGPAGPLDHVARPAELRRWLAERGLASGRAAVRAADVAGFHELRAAVRELLVARIEQREPAAAALREVNAAAASAPGALLLRWSGEPVPGWRPAAGSSPLDRARAAIAADAIDLVSGDRGRALLACGGPGCVRLLVKDHPRRLWCSPACGDRIRAARYYRRHKAAQR